MSEHKFEPAGSPEALASAAKAAGYTGTIPSDWLSYKPGEIVRIKGWLFKIEKAFGDGSLRVKALGKREMEEMATEAVRRIRRKQLVNDVEQVEKVNLDEIASVINMKDDTIPKEEPPCDEPS